MAEIIACTMSHKNTTPITEKPGDSFFFNKRIHPFQRIVPIKIPAVEPIFTNIANIIIPFQRANIIDRAVNISHVL
ncbi:MAG: hypothetical protein HFG78_08200 [Hungatella sp.]|nr:hypothetical protein [Hungatella sp.]